MSSQIRRAGPDDLDALVALHGEYCAIDGHTGSLPSARSAFAQLLAQDRFGVVLVVDSDTQLLGYAVLTWGFGIESGGLESLLDEVYVAERGQGLGTSLIDACLVEARARGARTMFLETEPHNARVRALYERSGFNVEDSVWMRRPLG